MYSPLLGRFLERDPLKADINVYRYCENDPLMKADPTGLADVFEWYRIRPSKVLGLYGSAVQHVHFQVNDQNGNGWIIQHVHGSAAAWDNNGPFRVRHPVLGPYPFDVWEAWPVVKGQVYIGTALHYADDWSTADARPCTAGWQDLTGYVRFVPNGWNGVDPSKWGHHPELSGDIFLTTVKPAGWQDQGAGVRQFQTNWSDIGEPKYQTRIRIDSLNGK